MIPRWLSTTAFRRLLAVMRLKREWMKEMTQKQKDGQHKEVKTAVHSQCMVL